MTTPLRTKTTTATTAVGAKRKLEHPSIQKKTPSRPTAHPAEYRVVATKPALEGHHHHHSSSAFPPSTSFPLDRPHVLDLELTRPAQLSAEYGADPDHLLVKVRPVSTTCLGVEIEPRDKRAWRVPEHVVARPHKETKMGGGLEEGKEAAAYEFVWDDPERFGFQVRHRATGETIFDTTKLGIVVRDQYLEISTRLGGGRRGDKRGQQAQEGTTEGQVDGERGGAGTSETYLYGLGENVGRFRRPAGAVSTMWARDCPCKPEHNLYGCHPFYMEVLPETGTAHGVLLLSSNGMDVSLAEPSGDLLTYKVIGGMLEFYFFSGPTPQDVVRQYTALIGRPLLIPYWALGNHQCRWGYDTLDKVKKVVQGFSDSQIPLEAMWIDIDYMDAYKCFTFASKRFPVKELATFSEQLHAQDQQLVMMLDPGIKLQYQPGLYPPYDEGVDKRLFIQRQVKEAEVAEAKVKHHKPGDLVDFVGKVWPGLTVFPDWFHPASPEYWTRHITDWVRQVRLDGIWIDMNEVASFHNGDASHMDPADDRVVQLADLAPPADEEEGGATTKATVVQPQHQEEEGTKNKRAKRMDPAEAEAAADESERPQEVMGEEEEELEEVEDLENKERRMAVVSMTSRPAKACGVMAGKDQGKHDESDSRPLVQYTNVNRPPYRINNNNEQAELEYRTVSADALHHGGVLEYDAHNLYGHMESMATYQAMREIYPDRKPFVLSRSTFVGTGQYACHWLGDNWSRWYDLRASIAGLLNFQLFGIPMVGSDVGGFGDVASEELLIRWHQLGSFYPFMRNHNCIALPGQEPYTTPRLAQATRRYLTLRYRLLPYWYTLFQKAHYHGDMVCAPLWTLASGGGGPLLDVDEQFLVGEAILVSPVLYEGATSVTAVFPRGLWYNLTTGAAEVAVLSSSVKEENERSEEKKNKVNHATVELQAPLMTMPVHVRGGSIVPMCGLPDSVPLMTTRQVQEAGLELLVALDDQGLARGEAVHDDDTQAVHEAAHVVMEVATPGVLKIECRAVEQTNKIKPTAIRSVVVWGLGLDQTKFGEVDGLVSPALQQAQAQVDIKQVRVARVDPVARAEQSHQHQRELAAVDSSLLEVLWDGQRAQLTIRFKEGEHGVVLRGGEGLELDWTQAIMA